MTLATPNPYGDYALRYRFYGLAVIPCGGDDGKTPLIKGFNKWNALPSEEAAERLRSRFPSANIGVLAGPSRIVWVDVDDMSALPEACAMFGSTPFTVRTARGMGLAYASGGWNQSYDLRSSHGLPIDIKAGAGHALWPPSVHRSGHVYRFENCSLDDLRRLPKFDPSALQNAIVASDAEAGGNGPTGPISEGRRWLALRRILCREGGDCHSVAEMLALAAARNSEFEPPLAEPEWRRLAEDTFAGFESGRLRRWRRGDGSRLLKPQGLFDFMMANGGKNSGDALALYDKLLYAHSAKMKRGETFCCRLEAMAEAGTLPGWTVHRLRRARDALISLGLLVRVSGSTFNGKAGTAARYRLSLPEEFEVPFSATKQTEHNGARGRT